MSSVAAVSIDNIKSLRKQLREQLGEFRKSLPVMPEELFLKLLDETVDVNLPSQSALPKDWKDVYQLSDTQEEMLEAAQADHKRGINEPEFKAGVAKRVGEADLTSFKVRINSKGEHKFKLTGKLKV